MLLGNSFRNRTYIPRRPRDVRRSVGRRHRRAAPCGRRSTHTPRGDVGDTHAKTGRGLPLIIYVNIRTNIHHIMLYSTPTPGGDVRQGKAGSRERTCCASFHFLLFYIIIIITIRRVLLYTRVDTDR